LKTIKSTTSRKSIGLSPSRVESVWVQAVDFKSTSSRIQVKSNWWTKVTPRSRSEAQSRQYGSACSSHGKGGRI